MPVDFKPKSTSTIQFTPKSVQPTSVMPKTATNWATNVPGLKQVQDFGIGVGSAIGNAGIGLGQLALKTGMAVGNIGNRIIPGSVDNSLAQGAYDTLEKAKQNIYNKPFEGNKATFSGQAGTAVGNIAPYLSGGAPTAVRGIFPRIAQGVTRAVPDMAVSAAQSQGAGMDNKDIIKNTLLTGGLSAFGTTLLPGADSSIKRKLLGNILPGYVADVSTGLAGQRGEDRKGGAAFIPGTGTAIGTVAGALQVVPKVKQQMQDYAPNKNYKTLETLQKNNKPLDRKIIAADKSGIDTKRVLAESNLLAGAVDTNGTVNSKIAVENLNEVLQPWESKVGDALAQENKRVPLADIQKKLVSTINDSGLVGTMKQQALSRASSELEALAQEADVTGTVPLKLVHDLKAQTNQTNAKSFIDPEKNAIGKMFARGLKEFVESSTDAIDVKTYNEELRKLYALRNVLEALDGKKVQGGRLGKYVAQTIGGVVGAHIGGPVGAIAGTEIGGALKGASMSRALGGAGGKPVEVTDRMKNALQPQSKSLGNLQMAQTINKAKPSNVIPSSKPQYNFPSSSVIPKSKKTSFIQEMSDKTRDEGQKGMVRNPFASQDPLTQEAKKYKSAEEFVRAQGTPVYHGTKSNIDIKDISAQPESRGQYLGNGIYFTKYKEGADLYGGKTLSAIVNEKDFLNISNLEGIERTNKIGSFGTYKQYLKNSNLDDTLANFKKWQKNQQEVADKILNMGYKGVTDGQQHVIFDKSAIKTKSQLTDIWNKANKPSYLNEMLNKAKTEGERGSVKLPFSGKTVKAIDALTKKELIDTAAYIRSNTYNKTKQDALDALAKKYEINTESGDKKLVLKQINALLNKTKTPETLPGTYTRKRI